MPVSLINGYRMHYETQGNGSPLLMIHGGLGGGEGSASIKRHHSLRLSERHQVVLYDRRSAGQSETPEDGYSLANYSEDAHQLLAHLGISQVHILGSSAGGPIAMKFALEHPEMTQSLLLVNTMSYYQETQRQVRKTELERVLSTIQNKENSTLNLNKDQSITSSQQEISQNNALAKTIRSYLDIKDSLERRLKAISVPTLIMHGDQDNRIPLECSLQLHSSIVESEFVVVPNAGHGLLSNEPTVTGNLIVEFLDKVDSQNRVDIQVN